MRDDIHVLAETINRKQVEMFFDEGKSHLRLLAMNTRVHCPRSNGGQ